MLTGDFAAKRDNPSDPDVASNAPALPGATERLYAAPMHQSFLGRFWVRAPSAAVSLLVHAALAAAFVAMWHSMVRDLTRSEPINVDLVPSIPGEENKSKDTKSPDPGAEASRPEQPAQARPDPHAKQPEPTAPARSEPEAQPEQSEQKEPASGPREVPDPRRAAAATQNPKPNSSNNGADLPAAEPATQPAVPQVLTVPEGSSTIAPPSATPDLGQTDKPVDSGPKTEADLTAKLAAALPMNMDALPSTFRAAMSSTGQSDAQEYKGLVYARLRDAEEDLAASARRRGLKGQVVLGLTIDDSGAIKSLALVQSSGNPEVDKVALGMVRKAGPFPPPPAGTPRSMYPVILLGDE